VLTRSRTKSLTIPYNSQSLQNEMVQKRPSRKSRYCEKPGNCVKTVGRNCGLVQKRPSRKARYCVLVGLRPSYDWLPKSNVKFCANHWLKVSTGRRDNRETFGFETRKIPRNILSAHPTVRSNPRLAPRAPAKTRGGERANFEERAAPARLSRNH
jgi:hypothetical protein